MNKDLVLLILILYLISRRNTVSNFDEWNFSKIQDIDTKANTINAETLTQFETSSGNEKRELETQIIENIFNNILRFEDISLAKTSNLRIVYGKVTNDSQANAIFIVEIGPKNTIVVVYEQSGNVYKFKSLVNNFMKIEELKPVKVNGNPEELIMLLERSNQMVGAFEDSSTLRAYKWNKDINKFEQILEAQKEYKSYWNELFDQKKPKNQSHWLMLKQHSDTSQDSDERINFKVNQQYQRSKQTNSVDMPKDENFETLRKKDFDKTYYWSNRWKQYILGEGVEVYTGLITAILEDLEQQPFSLIESDKRYKIKRPDGEISIVDKNTIQPQY